MGLGTAPEANDAHSAEQLGEVYLVLTTLIMAILNPHKFVIQTLFKEGRRPKRIEGHLGRRLSKEF
jgi:hypothetical protein